jgi:hypothetical protein
MRPSYQVDIAKRISHRHDFFRISILIDALRFPPLTSLNPTSGRQHHRQ